MKKKGVEICQLEDRGTGKEEGKKRKSDSTNAKD